MGFIVYASQAIWSIAVKFGLELGLIQVQFFLMYHFCPKILLQFSIFSSNSTNKAAVATGYLDKREIPGLTESRTHHREKPEPGRSSLAQFI